MVLISVSLILALILSYSLTKKYIQDEFSALKIEVLDQTIEPYNQLFQNEIPEISYYQGFLDSVSASKYVETIFKKYPFVENIQFFDSEVSNHPVNDGLKFSKFCKECCEIICFEEIRHRNPHVENWRSILYSFVTAQC